MGRYKGPAITVRNPRGTPNGMVSVKTEKGKVITIPKEFIHEEKSSK